MVRHKLSDTSGSVSDSKRVDAPPGTTDVANTAVDRQDYRRGEEGHNAVVYSGVFPDDAGGIVQFLSRGEQQSAREGVRVALFECWLRLKKERSKERLHYSFEVSNRHYDGNKLPLKVIAGITEAVLKSLNSRTDETVFRRFGERLTYLWLEKNRSKEQGIDNKQEEASLPDEKQQPCELDLAEIWKRVDVLTNAPHPGRPNKPVEPKKLTGVRITEQNLNWLKAKGPKYLTRINAILTAIREAEEHGMPKPG